MADKAVSVAESLYHCKIEQPGYFYLKTVLFLGHKAGHLESAHTDQHQPSQAGGPLNTAVLLRQAGVTVYA